MLSVLNFNLNFVTPLEAANQLLFLADPSFDYSVLATKLSAIINFCLIDFDISMSSQFTSFVIGLASALITLERMEWH